MQQTHRPWMQRTAGPNNIISSETVLIPSMLYRLHHTGENQKKWRQRTEFINPFLLLYFHPLLDHLSVIFLPPFSEIDHHYSRIKIARISSTECSG
eukprot:Gb_37201 [translate_table: standard]